MGTVFIHDPTCLINLGLVGWVHEIVVDVTFIANVREFGDKGVVGGTFHPVHLNSGLNVQGCSTTFFVIHEMMQRFNTVFRFVHINEAVFEVLAWIVWNIGILEKHLSHKCQQFFFCSCSRLIFESFFHFL